LKAILGNFINEANFSSNLFGVISAIPLAEVNVISPK
jgi:hypothetical protein